MKILVNVLCALTLVLSSLFFVLVTSEWLVGCGETYVAHDGAVYANKCLFLDK